MGAIKMDLKLKAEIKAVEDKNGRLTAENLYETALKKRDGELYKYGEKHGVWNKDEAQRNWGITVYQQCIHQWKVEVETTELEVVWRNEYVRDPLKAHKEPGMVSFTKIKGDKNLQRKVLLPYLQRALGNLETGYALADGLGFGQDLLTSIEDIKELIEKIKAPRRVKTVKRVAKEQSEGLSR